MVPSDEMPGMRIQIEPPLGLMVTFHLSVFLTKYDILNVQVINNLAIHFKCDCCYNSKCIKDKRDLKVFMNSKCRGNALLSLI